MNLHVFNPEHDLALAFGRKYFTSPHAGRQLRSDLGFIPVFWAQDGDMILVDDVRNALSQTRHQKVKLPDVLFITKEDLRNLNPQTSNLKPQTSNLKLSPWGWDAAIKHQLFQFDTPSDGQIEAIREMSNRRWAAEHLGNTGVYCTSMTEVNQQVRAFKRFVLKAPWSSSGRGVRYGWGSENPQSDLLAEGSPLKKWAQRVIEQQGGIMVEPYYNKVRDFGMEFEAHENGTVTYEGLSLFETVNGAYTGNLLACEDEKWNILTKYVAGQVLEEAKKNIIQVMSAAIRNIYTGPFGVDMMIVRDDLTSVPHGQCLLLPCVELNLRRTMGHVAIAVTRRITPDGTAPHQLMRIEYDGSHYHFRILNTQTNALNTNIMR